MIDSDSPISGCLVAFLPEPALDPPAGDAGRARLLPALLVLFVGSGCAALIYEVVWLQLLQLVIGSSAVSLGVLLGTFMGGMCLGSLALPRVVSPRRHPLRVYALIELCIGLIGVAVLYGMPLAGRLYVAHAGHGLAGILMRGALCALCLLPPTLLMGATLPAIARWVEATPRGISRLGFFYGSNIAGAVCGSLLAGFYLLRVHDMAVATYVAAAINVLVAGTGLLLARRTAYRPEEPGTQRTSDELRHEDTKRRTHEAEAGDPSCLRGFVSSCQGPGSRARGIGVVYWVIALSGMCALGAEVVWTRLLSLLLGGTVYTFSLILAAFLVGLGIGSAVGAGFSRRSPAAALGLCQLLVAGAIAWGAYAITQWLPYWPAGGPGGIRHGFALDLLRCALAVMPGALLWGASFPLAMAAAARGQDPGRLAGGVYAANTAGAIAGALAFSVLLVPSLGTRGSQQVMVGLAVVSALLLLLPLLREWWADTAGGAGRTAAIWAAMGAVPVVVALLIWRMPTLPLALVAYGRTLRTHDVGEALYVGEGMNSTVAVTELSDGVVNFHVSGKVEASTDPQDMRLQRMLGHLSALVHPRPRSVLVVGCGAGVTAGSFLLHPDVERIVLCEIEPLIPKRIARYFSAENYGLVDDPRVEVVYDDARHYVLTTGEKFDVITSDPIHPWVKGSAALYTREYFELCRRRLNPGGVVTQWVPLYESTPEAVKSELATFFAAFPHGTIWGNDDYGEGYDAVVLGRIDATPIDVAELQGRLERADHRGVLASLDQVGLGSAIDLLSTYAGADRDLAPWLEGAQMNTDRNLRLQYLAGMGLNDQQGAAIYDEILSYRRFPDGLFVADPGLKQSLRVAIETPRFYW